MESFSDDILRKLFLDLTKKDEWGEECEICRMPTLLHHDQEGRPLLQSCAGRRTGLTEAAQDKIDAEILDTWSKFGKKMAPIRKAYRRETDKTKSNNEIATSLQRMTETIINGNTSRPSKLVKQTKVPSWCKGMKYEAYKKSILVWVENNKDISEAVRYQDVIESLKTNKDIEGLAIYTGEHIVGKLDTTEAQTIKELLQQLDIKYGRTRLEELEELMEEWVKFNFNEYENEEEYLFAQEKLISRQDEKEITMREWNAVWMMYGASQRKGMESYQLLELRNIVKENGGEVQKDFVKKYRELKVESNRGKQAPCVNTLYAYNQRIRRDSQGRDYYQERKSRYDSRGRPFVRRYFRKDNNRQRSFSRDMRSVSRNRNKSRDKRDGNRQERGRSTGRKNDKKQELSCTGCTCDNCEKLREAAKGLNVN